MFDQDITAYIRSDWTQDRLRKYISLTNQTRSGHPKITETQSLFDQRTARQAVYHTLHMTISPIPIIFLQFLSRHHSSYLASASISLNTAKMHRTPRLHFTDSNHICPISVPPSLILLGQRLNQPQH